MWPCISRWKSSTIHELEQDISADDFVKLTIMSISCSCLCSFWPCGALGYSRWFLENYQMIKEYSCEFLFLRYSRYSWQDCSGKSRIIFLTFSDDNWIFLKTFGQNYMYLCKIILLPPFFILSLPLSRCPESKTLLYNQWTNKRQHCVYMIVVCIVIQESDK